MTGPALGGRGKIKSRLRQQEERKQGRREEKSPTEELGMVQLLILVRDSSHLSEGDLLFPLIPCVITAANLIPVISVCGCRPKEEKQPIRG